jgi:pimeloyl-ACP methyl ester carboxylesterase
MMWTVPPGCGETACDVSDLSTISIPFLVNTAKAVLDCLGVSKFHLIGHSMGGLTALMLAHRYPDHVLSFVNIKGNLAPEDCFLSRQIITHELDDTDVFFNNFIERTRRSPDYSNALYAANLRSKVRPGAVAGIFKSMVLLSDHGDLMTKFLALPCPLMFMYGEQNAGLSYLWRLKASDVELAEISYNGHFPMYSNPPETFRRISQFLDRIEPKH